MVECAGNGAYKAPWEGLVMKHIHVISRASIFGGGLTTGLDTIESVIIMLMSVFFNSWDNFSSVIQNLQKFYQKT